MKRPSFQFYPADWCTNAKLRRCTEAARGVWMDILCVLHDQDEYGVCRWPLEELARVAGARLSLVKELVERGVLKGASKNKQCDAYIYIPRSGRKDGNPVVLVPAQMGPIWYSSRFVRDEYKRLNTGSNTRFGSPARAPSHRQGEDEKTGNNEKSFFEGGEISGESVKIQDENKKPVDKSVSGCNSSIQASPSHRQGDGQGAEIPSPAPCKNDGSSSSSSLSKKETPISPNPEEAARTQRDDYFRKCFDLITEKFPILTAQDTSHIYAWKRAGYDFDTQIKPIVDATPKNKAVRTFNYFTHVLNNLTEVKSAPPKPEPPPDLPKQTPEEKRVWYRKHGLHHAEFNPCAEKD